MNCKNCGNPLVPGEQTCRYCGAQVDTLNNQTTNTQNYYNNQATNNSLNNNQYSYDSNYYNTQVQTNMQDTNMYTNQNTAINNNSTEEQSSINNNQNYYNQATTNSLNNNQNYYNQATTNSLNNNQNYYNGQNNNSQNYYSGQTINQYQNNIQDTNMNPEQSTNSNDNLTEEQNLNNNINNIPGYTAQSIPNPEKIEDYYSNNKDKKKGNKKLVLIFILVIILIALSVGILLLNNNPKTTKNKGNNTKQEDSTTISYNGFKIKKLDGYNYYEDDGILNITSKDSESFSMSLKVSEANFDNLKTSYTTLKEKIIQNGLNAMDPQIKTVSNNEFITCVITEEADSMIYYISKANDNLIFEGMVMNGTKTLSNYEDLDTVVKILKEVTYVGGVDNYSKEYGDNLDLYYNSSN